MTSPSRPHTPGGGFSTALISAVRELGHPLCVGLDPHLHLIPPLFRDGTMDPKDPRTAPAVERFFLAVLDRLEGKTAIVKPQSAFFEAFGPPGMEVLARLMHTARERGLLVLLDAKRGDIGSTAKAYAAALLGKDAPFPADALTINPYLGGDSLRPFVDRAATVGGGLFVLVKTSNPGAGDLQDRRLDDGTSVRDAVAQMLSPLSDELRAEEGAFSSLGVVVGATQPEDHQRVRELLPHALFLVPGYGAQGGSAADAVRGFVPGPNGLEGGIVNSSRGVVFPQAGQTDDTKTWESVLDEALKRAAEDLRAAVAG